MQIRFVRGLTMITALFVGQVSFSQFPYTEPVLQVDVPYATADKPQSKLFYMSDCWWAILPRKSGPSLWRRTTSGWLEDTAITRALKGLPGRADLWAGKNEVMVVSVDSCRVTVFRLKQIKAPDHWQADKMATLLLPEKSGPIESATITREASGRWWVAADVGTKICTWSSGKSGRHWSRPLVMAEGVHEDDICLITEVPGGVGLIWSDQQSVAFKMRVHKDGKKPDQWAPEVTIEQGNHVADDHLNAALSADGTLWLATKNSVDKHGHPQLVLRVRSPGGSWKKFPYAIVSQLKEPTRPVVISTEDPSITLLGHTVNDPLNRFQGKIVFGRIDTTSLDADHGDFTTVIAPDTSSWKNGNRINDITGPKKPFLMDAPWIVLASDMEGRVYEADLRKLISATKERTN